jgi:hypothetical protein
MRDTDMLHYHNFNGMAVLLYIVTFYFIKAINYEYFDYEIPSEPSEAKLLKVDSIFLLVTKLIIFGLLDYSTSRLIPKMIFGTHKLNY